MKAIRLLAVLLLLVACGEEGGKAPHVGNAPAPFKLMALDGTSVDYPSATAGKVVVVRFWATWCPFCKDEMKMIQTVWSQSRDKGFEVLAVNAGQDKGDIEGFIAKLGVTYPVLLDPGSKVTRQYGVTGLPMTLFIGRDGKVKGRILGETDEATFRRKLDELL
ncbi:MAG: TlpA disulfide reductase family protein [Phaeospirillum sp.]|nr:TlpA disulfide reductase family protein [Phaeospirillum sp.]